MNNLGLQLGPTEFNSWPATPKKKLPGAKQFFPGELTILTGEFWGGLQGGKKKKKKKKKKNKKTLFIGTACAFAACQFLIAQFFSLILFFPPLFLHPRTFLGFKYPHLPSLGDRRLGFTDVQATSRVELVELTSTGCQTRPNHDEKKKE